VEKSFVQHCLEAISIWFRLECGYRHIFQLPTGKNPRMPANAVRTDHGLYGAFDAGGYQRIRPTGSNRTPKSSASTAHPRTQSKLGYGLSVYILILIAIFKKELKLDASLYTLLQILSVLLFEKMPIFRLFLTTACNSTTLKQITN